MKEQDQIRKFIRATQSNDIQKANELLGGILNNKIQSRYNRERGALEEGRLNWRQTPTGKLIVHGSGPKVLAALDDGDVKLAVALQARSGATYRGRKRDEKHRRNRVTKKDRKEFSAQTFHTMVSRAFREAGVDPNI